MEGIPKKISNEKEKESRLGKTARALIAGTALFGATAMAPQSAEAAQPRVQYEENEAFSAEEEAQAFLEKIATLDAGFDDARGRQKLRTIVGEYLSMFALAFDQKVAHFSSNESSSIGGDVTPQAREAALQYLATKILSFENSGDAPGIIVLKTMLSGPSMTPTPDTPDNVSVPNLEPNDSTEVRRYKGDW